MWKPTGASQHGATRPPHAIAERTRDALRHKRAKGEVYNHAPLGYIAHLLFYVHASRTEREPTVALSRSPSLESMRYMRLGPRRSLYMGRLREALTLMVSMWICCASDLCVS